VSDENLRFTEEALKSQDGKKVPLRLGNDGPIVGEATMKYDPETKSLMADLRVDDPQVDAALRMEQLITAQPPFAKVTPKKKES